MQNTCETDPTPGAHKINQRWLLLNKNGFADYAATGQTCRAEPELIRNALQPGRRVLWYEIVRTLGQGGFGITYVANDTNLQQEVALKEFLPTELAIRVDGLEVQPVSSTQAQNFAWGLDKFMVEARTLARFDHPNIVKVYSVFEANNTVQ